MKRLAMMLCALAVAASAPLAQEFPRPMLGMGLKGNGWPMTIGPQNGYAITRYGPINEPMLDKMARFDLIIMPAFMVTNIRPDLVQALRKRNPRIKVLGSWLYGDIWPVINGDTTLAGDWWRYLDTHDGFIYRTNGARLETPVGCVNVAKRGPDGSWPVADTLFGLIRDKIISQHVFDGLFLDLFHTGITWGGYQTIDYRRAGYADQVAYDIAHREAGDRISRKLREFVGKDFIIVANGQDRPRYDWFNGSMRERFPNQSGGTWYTNITQEPRGYLADCMFYPRVSAAGSGSYCILMSAGGPAQWSPYTPDAMRIARWGLGSASMGDGWAGVGDEETLLNEPTYLTWWYDEYSVNPATGVADTTGEYRHWLGKALGPAYRVPPPGRYYRRDFERGIVVVNPESWEQSVVTERPFRRIEGVKDTLVNDGVTATVHRLRARDALFLLRTEGTP